MDEYDLIFEDAGDLRSTESGSRYMNMHLVQTIHDCEASCEHMTHHIKMQPDFQARMSQATILRECADICCLTAKILARGAADEKQTAQLCVKICRVCGLECAKFSDRMSQECSKTCLNCAKECGDFVNR
ncbi:MAG: hypothetical protein WCP73_02000 [Eubacteriales bacterium]